MAPRGVGIGLRREHHAAFATLEREVDWLEIVPENAIADPGRTLPVVRRCAERWPIGTHGVSLSLGGPEPLDRDYLDRLARLLDLLGADSHSEHACWSSAGGVMFHDLLPLPFSEAAAEHLAARARSVRDHLGRPLLLENITYYATMPAGGDPVTDEGTWLRWVLEAADAGLLLDLNNVWVNARNHGQDPRALLASMPLERTRRIHLAGHVERHGMLVDNHGRAVCDGVWALYEEVIARLGPVPTLVEWDLDVPPLERVLDEADRARAIMHRHPLARAA